MKPPRTPSPSKACHWKSIGIDESIRAHDSRPSFCQSPFNHVVWELKSGGFFSHFLSLLFIRPSTLCHIRFCGDCRRWNWNPRGKAFVEIKKFLHIFFVCLDKDVWFRDEMYSTYLVSSVWDSVEGLSVSRSQIYMFYTLTRNKKHHKLTGFCHNKTWHDWNCKHTLKLNEELCGMFTSWTHLKAESVYSCSDWPHRRVGWNPEEGRDMLNIRQMGMTAQSFRVSDFLFWKEEICSFVLE